MTADPELFSARLKAARAVVLNGTTEIGGPFGEPQRDHVSEARGARAPDFGRAPVTTRSSCRVRSGPRRAVCRGIMRASGARRLIRALHTAVDRTCFMSRTCRRPAPCAELDARGAFRSTRGACASEAQPGLHRSGFARIAARLRR